MWTYQYPNELQHYGILGMKWGVRRKQEQTYRQKITALTKNKNITNTDADRFKIQNQHVAKRIVKTAAVAATQIIIGDIMSGNASLYSNMPKKDIVKRLSKDCLK